MKKTNNEIANQFVFLMQQVIGKKKLHYMSQIYLEMKKNT
jgi:hypothetical protein